MNPNLNKLHTYPFQKLAALKSTSATNSQLPHIDLSIGEPKHPPPEFVLRKLEANLGQYSKYPATRGTDELKTVIANWATRRFKLQSLKYDSEVLPASGTREAIFSFIQCLSKGQGRKILMPNPFYQIYEGATYLAGATPYFMNCLPENDFNPDFDAISEATWNECDILFICSPGNPTGAVLNLETLTKLIQLADKHDFIIASDECYSELYFDETHPPTGLLEACASIGRHDYSRCVVFHSLSKRSNLPGMRSGFVAGDASLLKDFLLYRTYHGSAMPIPTQIASAAAWEDEQHVIQNRALYKEKFDTVLSVLGDSLKLSMPDAGFYLWVSTPIASELFAQKLYEQKNITVLPGDYLAREHDGINPGTGRVRMALVASVEECEQAAQRIKDFLTSL
jgi:N-succinyldiaminopimelate aminotransferase